MPKRKRDSESAPTTSTLSNRDAINAIFRANFESKFGSIDISPVVIPQDSKDTSSKSRSKKQNKPSEVTSDDDNDDDDEEYSEDEDIDLDSDGEEEDSDSNNDEDPSKPPEPEVITYDFSRRGPPPTAKPSHRSFMSSKPPSSSSSTQKLTQNPSSKLSKSEQAAEALNLEHDQALHRLLTESHLLDSTLSHSSAKNRHKAIESRIISLGGNPIKQKGNIPMHIQKGMKLKQRLREEKVKREAKENGVVIDKESKRAKERRKDMERMQRRKGEKRDAGVGHASIGKFRGGELRLSRRDVAGMRA
ncbi:hypothetical protein TWF281_002795 [Arthrobotrys megalospora]